VDIANVRLSEPLGRHPSGMTTALVVAFALAAWTVLPLPLAVLVGRCMALTPDLTPAPEFHTLEA